MNEGQSRKAILAVDDNPRHLKLLALQLTGEGYRVITAQNGNDALEAIALEKPGLVLLDLLMPNMNGFELLKRIKALEPDVPVAMVTSVWDNDEARRAFEVGAYDYITKPVDVEQLKLAVLIKLFPDE